MKRFVLVLIGAVLASCSSPSPAPSSSAAPSSTSVASVTSSKESESSAPSSSSPEQTSLSSNEASSSSAESRVELDPMKEPDLGRQYYLNHIGDVYSAWGSYRGRGVTIAVIDVGFNPYHPDFTYGDGTSKVSPLSASIATKDNKNTTVSVGVDKVSVQGESHGTFCAGFAAAGANGKGIVGVAPEAELMLLKTDCKPKSIARAFTYAADNGAKVISISLGSYYDSTGDLIADGSDLGTVFDAPVAYCYNKGVPVISAGGNGGLDGIPTEFTFPGCVDHVIGVGGLAANSSSEIWEGTSYNSSPQWQFIDVLAPAERMYGTCVHNSSGYDIAERGTSFAAPLVAGMAALYFEANPSKGAKDFEKALFDSCHRLTTSSIATADQLGYGRVDLGALLSLKAPTSLNAKVKVNWSTCYAYVWNSVSGRSAKAWPGTAITKKDGYFVTTLNASSYDSVIFTQGEPGGHQTVDLLATSFLGDMTLDLTSARTEGGCLVGAYK